jgi:hypothetical protein
MLVIFNVFQKWTIKRDPWDLNVLKIFLVAREKNIVVKLSDQGISFKVTIEAYGVAWRWSRAASDSWYFFNLNLSSRG